MKTTLSVLLLLLAALGLSGCLYSNVRMPLDTDLDRTEIGELTGESSYHSVLWLVAWGDAGTQAAAEEGGIRRLDHMDVDILNILWGLYYRQTTVVYGD